MNKRVGAVAALLGAGLWLGAGGPAARATALGDAARGRALFDAKHCARCHRPDGEAGAGPALAALRRPQGAWELAGRLWNHAPAMFAALTRERLAWPRISAAEMADLMSYLAADPARDPAPDLARGQVTLVAKGCLKCHALKGEGATVGPDFARRQPDHGSPAEWAARMWAHTPGMAAKARERGFTYPRFSGDEMLNLVAFLRHAAAN